MPKELLVFGSQRFSQKASIKMFERGLDISLWLYVCQVSSQGYNTPQKPIFHGKQFIYHFDLMELS